MNLPYAKGLEERFQYKSNAFECRWFLQLDPNDFKKIYLTEITFQN